MGVSMLRNMSKEKFGPMLKRIQAAGLSMNVTMFIQSKSTPTYLSMWAEHFHSQALLSCS